MKVVMKKLSIVLMILVMTFSTAVKSEDEYKIISKLNLEGTVINADDFLFMVDFDKVPELKGIMSDGAAIALDVNSFVSDLSESGSSLSYLGAEQKIELQSYNTSKKYLFLADEIPSKIYILSGNKKYVSGIIFNVRKDKDTALVKDYYNRIINTGSSSDMEIKFRKSVLQRRFTGKTDISMDTQFRRNRTGEIIELIELTSGSRAMEESLQFMTMRDISTKESDRSMTVDVKTLKSPGLDVHNFDSMIKKKMKVPGSSKLAPYDCIYVRFDKIKNVFKVFDIADLFREDLPAFTDFIGESDDLKGKILQQLALKLNPPLRKFYGLAVDDCSFVLSDPYMIEGADLAIIFKLSNRVLFDETVNSYRKSFRESVDGAVQKDVIYKDVKINALTSPGGELRSYIFYIDDSAVLSNSLSLSKRIIDTTNGSERAVADNPDFRYLMEVHNGPGDGFIYIGDDFVKRITGAPFKISELRRVNCEAAMKILTYADNFYKIEKGAHPSIDDLVKNGYLAQEPLCPSGGKYSITGGKVNCSKHGRLGHLENLSVNEVKFVTENEANLYNEFSENYKKYWSHYVDPVGIRIELNDLIKIRTVILPLTDDPDYKMIESFMGGKPVKFEGAEKVNNKVLFNFSGKIRVFDEYKKDLSNIADARTREKMSEIRAQFQSDNPEIKEDLYGWIGNEFNVYALDMPDGRYGQDSIYDEFNESGDFTSFLKLFAVRLKINNAGTAEKIIQKMFKTDAEPVKGYGGILFDVRLFGKETLLLRDDGLWIVSDRKVFDLLFAEKIKDTLENAAGFPDSRKGNIEAGFHPQNLKNLKKIAALYFNMLMKEKCSSNKNLLLNTLMLHEPFANVKKMSVKDITDIYLSGKTILCPTGGVYRNGKNGFECSIHDSDVNIHDDIFKLLESRNSGVYRLLTRIKSLGLLLSVTPDGLDTQIYFHDPVK
jgi:hypothetical protein